ncbi:MAG: XRE family transcriptional regulator [Campylobacterales bacterium]|nr:XRE family transcriptional regulator [Campylobacterales bacterium]
MAIIMNNHVFKGHRALLGSKFVTYGELELPTRYEIYPLSNNGFEWGNSSKGANQLAFSILFQLSDEETAKEYTDKFTNDIVKKLSSRDWVLSASEVLRWLEANVPKQSVSEVEKEKKNTPQQKQLPKRQKAKQNVVKEICKELEITQKQLSEILEVPEGTVSSWAVKNEIPRLGKKAIEFYIANQKNQKIVDSYKNFIQLLQEI